MRCRQTGRILECASMKVEEAALTGESVPVLKTERVLSQEEGTKDVPLGDRKNMVYMGSTVVYGRGAAVVTGTGMDTEMGKIADALARAKENQTPLQKKLTQLSKTLSVLVLGICVFIFIFSLVRAGDFHTEVLIDTFMVAVSLAVAAIPEGLATVVTIVLAIGVTNMSKKKAIIRKLTAVETLGCAQVVCSDKTGTLTQNKMTVVEMADSEHALDMRGTEPEFILNLAVLCNNCTVSAERVNGDPTEAALVIASKNKKNVLEQQYPRIKEIPFSSDRKRMTTIHRLHTGGYRIITKGAPDVLLNLCTGYISKITATR